MAQAISASRDGADFQARIFWWYALRLLDADSPIVRVGFEAGPKSFDDIWVDYAPGKAPSDHEGKPLQREHFQCKWHVEPKTYGYRELVDPAFVNAKAASLLQRARNAQTLHAPDGFGSRFKLLTNWRIATDDPVRRMISTRSNALRVERLFATLTDNSGAGEVRKLWRDHLEIDEDELRIFARTLAIGEAPDSLDAVRDQLDMGFKAVGLERVAAHKASFFYDDLIYKWMGQQPIAFDRESFRAKCAQEGILADPKPATKVYGVKSFQHAFDQLDNRCADVLDLVPLFDERFIRTDSEWSTKIYPDLKAFLTNAARDDSHLRLALDTHASLAFAAGSVLNIKSGRHIELEQRSPATVIWSSNDMEPAVDWATLSFEQVTLDGGASDLAIALGVTHDVVPRVTEYLRLNGGTAGVLLIATPSTGPGAKAVRGGRHAHDLAEALAAKVSTLRPSGSENLSHLFMAAPNALAFFVGQRLRQLGPVRLYEFDFEGTRDGSYRPSLTLSADGKISSAPATNGHCR